MKTQHFLTEEVISYVSSLVNSIKTILINEPEFLSGLFHTIKMSETTYVNAHYIRNSLDQRVKNLTANVTDDATINSIYDENAELSKKIKELKSFINLEHPCLIKIKSFILKIQDSTEDAKQELRHQIFLEIENQYSQDVNCIGSSSLLSSSIKEDL